MSILSKITTGVAGLALLGVGGYAVAFIPTPLSTGIAPLSTVVSPESVTRNIVCAGDVVGHEGDSASISRINSVARSVAGGDVTGNLAASTGENGSVITRNGDTLLVAATESDAVSSEIATGYLATECGDPLNEQWLVGGSTTTGRDTILTISNGSDVEARIDLDIWGSTGLVDAPGSKGIVVPAKSQRSYSVAGFAPDEESPAIHLVSSGAAVWATLQMTTVRGLVAGGLDRIGPVTDPTTTVNFPVLHVPTEESIGAVLSDPSYSDIVAALRFLVPGETDASVTITLDPYADGEPQVVSATIPAGATLDIPLADLVPGDWAISVTSDQPILAAARVGFHDVASGITDVAWSSAAPAQKGIASVVAPSHASLGLANPSDNDAVVTLQIGGVDTEVTVPGHGNYLTTVEAGLITVTSTTEISTSLFVSTSSGIATLRGLVAPIDAGSVLVVNG